MLEKDLNDTLKASGRSPSSQKNTVIKDLPMPKQSSPIKAPPPLKPVESDDISIMDSESDLSSPEGSPGT